MKRVILILAALVISSSVFALPPGISEKPVDQLMEYIGKPVPEKWSTLNKGSTFHSDIIGNERLAYYLTVSPLSNMVNSVVIVWCGKDPARIEQVWNELLELMNQQGLRSIPASKPEYFRWEHGIRSFELQREGGTNGYSYCSIHLL